MSEATELKIGGLEVVDIQGMGDIGISYRAKKSGASDELVFLKVLKWDFPTTEDRLQAEFVLRRASLLNHSNLAKISDVGVTDARIPGFNQNVVITNRSTLELPWLQFS